MTKQNKLKNNITMLVLTMLMGAFAGLVVWCFLKAVSLGTSLCWEVLPDLAGTRLILPVLCAVGGLLAGIIRKKSGDYPEELSLVMDKIKKEKYYSYRALPAMLICAFIPLVFGSSVGPEAGLTGIIAALCYWVGDNVTFAKNNAALFSEIGEAVTLGQLFHSPLFGILAVEESGDQDKETVPPLFKSSKLVFYGLSTVSGFFSVWVLNRLFGKAMSGFPSFSEVTSSPKDYALMLLYVPVGILLCLFFEGIESISKKIAGKIPPVLKEGICGLVIGLMALVIPMVLFSGEEQMSELMEDFGSYAPVFLIGMSLLKMVMTGFCISFGMKGGHFFPVIFACTLMGYGLAILLFSDPGSHVVFAAGCVTAAMLGAQLKKPFAAAFLLLLCFPPRFLFWLFLCAAIGGRVMLLLKPEAEKTDADKKKGDKK